LSKMVQYRKNTSEWTPRSNNLPFRISQKGWITPKVTESTMLRRRRTRIISISHAQNRVDQFARWRGLACSSRGRSSSATGGKTAAGAGTGSGNWVVPGNSAAIIPDLYAPEGNEPLRIRLHFCPGCPSRGNNPFYEKMQYLKNQADSRGSES